MDNSYSLLTNTILNSRQFRTKLDAKRYSHRVLKAIRARTTDIGYDTFYVDIKKPENRKFYVVKFYLLTDDAGPMLFLGLLSHNNNY